MIIKTEKNWLKKMKISDQNLIKKKDWNLKNRAENWSVGQFWKHFVVFWKRITDWYEKTEDGFCYSFIFKLV